MIDTKQSCQQSSSFFHKLIQYITQKYNEMLYSWIEEMMLQFAKITQ